MAKLTKAKAVKFPKKSHAELFSTKSKKTRCIQRKAATTKTYKPQQPEASKDNELKEPATDTLTLKIPACVVSDKYLKCTEHLLDNLDAHPDVTILFRDSTQTAKSKGHSKLTIKLNVAAAYLQVIDGIFSINHDPESELIFASNLNKYLKAANNYLTIT
jgi:hypothetical protein